MSVKQLTVFIVILSIVTAGAVAFIFNSKKDGALPAAMSNGNNVVTTEGKQVIEIDAKGGYSPRTTSAKAGVPTVLKVKTSGTFDCSSSLVIPDIGYRKNLPPSGETLIDLPPQEVGFVLRGTCSMGMYNFEVNFI
jgi:plastocyanin domain-containing protein